MTCEECSCEYKRQDLVECLFGPTSGGFLTRKKASEAFGSSGTCAFDTCICKTNDTKGEHIYLKEAQTRIQKATFLVDLMEKEKVKWDLTLYECSYL